MRAVVLGDGLLGMHAIRALADGGHWLRPMSRANLDLLDPVPADLFLGADLVVNTMAMTDVDACEERPKEAARVNAEAAGEVAAAAREAGALLVHVSTDYVLAPASVYARTKLDGERLVRERDPDAVVVRCSTTFGPHPIRRDFVKWVLGELRAKGQVTVFDDMWSSPTYAPEAARFIAEGVERGLGAGVYHVANHHGISRHDFAVLAQRAFGVPGAILRGKLADFKGFKAPRAADTRMPRDAPEWWEPMPLEQCLADYAARERAEGAAKAGVREE